MPNKHCVNITTTWQIFHVHLLFKYDFFEIIDEFGENIVIKIHVKMAEHVSRIVLTRNATVLKVSKGMTVHKEM
jgi:hypothetical protein